MSADFLSADIRKKLREFELQVQFTCSACRGRASDASAGSGTGCLGILGPSGCGKTTLSQRLIGEQVSYKKTQSIQVIGDDIVDTPGEYVEQKQFYSALIVTAVEADVILLLSSAIDEQNAFSPRMGSLFSGKPVIGVITKTDLCEDPELIEGASEILSMAGAETIIEVGFGDDSCLEKLREAIETAE